MAEQPTELESYFLDLVNGTRAGVGALPLTFDGELNNAADDHNDWMDANDTPSHTGANGSSIQDRIAASGYDANWYGENIWFEWGTNSTGATAEASQYFVGKSHNWFLNSPGHYAAMINPNYTEVGISFREGDYQGNPAVWATINFGSPTEAEAAEDDQPLPGGPDRPVPGDDLLPVPEQPAEDVPPDDEPGPGDSPETDSFEPPEFSDEETFTTEDSLVAS